MYMIEALIDAKYKSSSLSSLFFVDGKIRLFNHRSSFCSFGWNNESNEEIKMLDLSSPTTRSAPTLISFRYTQAKTADF